MGVKNPTFVKQRSVKIVTFAVTGSWRCEAMAIVTSTYLTTYSHNH